MRRRRERKQQEKAAAAALVRSHLEAGTPIHSAKQIQMKMYVAGPCQLSLADVQRVMREDCGLSYRRTRAQTPLRNLPVNLVVRQQYAVTLLQQHSNGRRVINVDESSLNCLNYPERLWLPQGLGTQVSVPPLTPRLSLLAAIDTEGRVYAALSQATTDNDTMLLFVTSLVRTLDLETPGWKRNTVMLLDGAKYHTSQATRELFKRLDVDVVYTGPYSYDSSPVEQLFCHLKRGNLNPDGAATGTR